MALPMTLIMLAGEIDLSVASILALSSEMLGYLWLHHWSMALIFVVCSRWVRSRGWSTACW